MPPADDNELSRLYESFINAAETDGDFSGFSKDDLIDIFDYSRGVPNDFISEQVLVIGLMRYPDSVDLFKRKALLFYDLGRVSMAEEALGKLPENEFVRQVGVVRFEWAVCHSVKKLDEILPGHANGSIEDGDIMFLVDVYEEMDRLDELIAHADRVSEISQYPATIFSELFNLYIDRGDYEKAIGFGLKLTEIEPFNFVWWSEIASIYLTQLDRPDDAIEAAEYALAINPQQQTAQMIKALALYDSDHDAARAMVRDALEEDENNASALYVAACIDFFENRQQHAIANILRILIGFDFVRARDAIDLLFKSITEPLTDDQKQSLAGSLSNMREIDIEKWVDRLLHMHLYRGAVELADIGISLNRYSFNTAENITAISEAMYKLKMYREVCSLFSGFENNYAIESLPYNVALMYALSLYHLGLSDRVHTFLEMFKSNLVQSQTDLDKLMIHERLIYDATIDRLYLLCRFINGDTDVSESDFDL
ncbi:MAG: hypothetical protein NC111_02380 [Bacteroides sp.]|nr:hypothetical protein [Bacteroides sp.]MCM1413424.1 hypothetical protein [Bacteroides sp.]MCM1471365.1 hypothetical protein [Bacteroides sp.]